MAGTAHIKAEPEDVAETVIMPGDPLRAKFIAENYLDDYSQFNDVRGMLGFTGTHKGKRVSVMGHGMGIPSVGIYSYELFKFFGVENIMRIGSCGALREDVKLKELIIGQGASTNSSWQDQYGVKGHFAPLASWSLLSKAVASAEQRNITHHVGNILANDIFYDDDPDQWKAWAKLGVLAVEMEATSLYSNAARLDKNALVMLTVSDSLVTHEAMSPEDRQTTFTDMMDVAFDVALQL